MQCDALLPMLLAAGCGTGIGVDLFVDFMPSDVQLGIVILSTLAGTPINWEIGSKYRKNDRFQLLVRSLSRDVALNLAIKAATALTINREYNIPALNNAPAIHVQYLRPLHTPIVYPRQINKGWEVSTNFEASYAINS